MTVEYFDKNLNTMSNNSELNIPNISSSEEDNVDVKSCLIDSTRLQNKVRRTYLKHLEMLLKRNFKRGGITTLDRDVIHKVAVSLELAAARASMVVALYQKQMMTIISDIKRSTKEGRLNFSTLENDISSPKETLCNDKLIQEQIEEKESEEQLPITVHVTTVTQEQNDKVINDGFDQEEDIALMDKNQFIDFVNLKPVPSLNDLDVLKELDDYSTNIIWNESSNDPKNSEEKIINADSINLNNSYDINTVLSLDQRLEDIYAGSIPALAAIINDADENSQETKEKINSENTINENAENIQEIENDNISNTADKIIEDHENHSLKNQNKNYKKKSKIKCSKTKNVYPKPKDNIILNEEERKIISSPRKSTEDSLDELLERQLEQVHSGIDPFEEKRKEEELEQKRLDEERLISHWRHARRFYSRRQAYHMSFKTSQQNERVRLKYYHLLGERFDGDLQELADRENSRLRYRKQLAPIIVHSLMNYLKLGYMKNRMAFKTMAKRIAADADDLNFNENEIVQYIHTLFLDNLKFSNERDVWDYSPRVHFTNEEFNNQGIRIKIEKDIDIPIKQEKMD